MIVDSLYFTAYLIFSVFNVFSLVPGVGAAWNTANVSKGSTVAVFGLGAVGLAVSKINSFSEHTKIIYFTKLPVYLLSEILLTIF